MESCSFLFSGQLRLFSVTNTRLSLGINHLFLTGSLWTKSYFYFCFCLREQNHRESHTQHLPLSKILWFFQDGISFWEVTILPVCCKLSLFQEWIWVSITFIVAPTVSAIWPAWSKTCWQYLQGECGRTLRTHCQKGEGHLWNSSEAIYSHLVMLPKSVIIICLPTESWRGLKRQFIT